MAKRNKSQQATERTAGRYEYEGLHRAIHEKARLGLMTSLVTHSAGLSFNDLKDLCGLTDGNLNRHLEVLREAGLITVQKDQGASRRQTLCRVTTRGKEEFADYLAELERVVADAAQGSQLAEGALSKRKGWSVA